MQKGARGAYDGGQRARRSGDAARRGACPAGGSVDRGRGHRYALRDQPSGRGVGLHVHLAWDHGQDAPFGRTRRGRHHALRVPDRRVHGWPRDYAGPGPQDVRRQHHGDLRYRARLCHAQEHHIGHRGGKSLREPRPHRRHPQHRRSAPTGTHAPENARRRISDSLHKLGPRRRRRCHAGETTSCRACRTSW